MHDVATAQTAASVAVNTTLALCIAGGIVFSLRAKVLPPKMKDVGAFCNGILAGLVSITAGCGSVKHWEAIVIGAIGGCIYCFSSMMIQKLKIDDVVDAFSVHGACGLWGVVAVGFFGDPEAGGNGVFYSGNQLGTQVFAVFIIILWTSFFCTLVLLPLKLGGLLRLSDSFQDAGADVMEHSPSKAYKDKRRGTDAQSSGAAPAPAPAPAAEPAPTGEEIVQNDA